MNPSDSSQLKEALLDVLASIPALSQPTNRNVLLLRLPTQGLTRPPGLLPDLLEMIDTMDALGMLDNGEWPLAILIRNAQRFAPANTALGKRLEELLAQFELSFNRQPPVSLPEVVIGADERLPVDFLASGLQASRAVARLNVPRFVHGRPDRSVAGTGWLAGDALLFTNYHVIAARYMHEPAPDPADLTQQVAALTAWFDYNAPDQAHTDYGGAQLIQCDPRLDYALLKLSGTPLAGGQPLSAWGRLTIAWPPLNLPPGQRLNIIQHPLGHEKCIAIRGNYYVCPSPSQTAGIQYLTDTEPGASGSPVCNDRWEVIALHHAAVPVTGAQPHQANARFYNEGVLMSAILDDLKDAGLRARLRPA